MGLKALIKGNNYDKTVIRREKTSNGFKNVKDKAAEIQDSDTGETLLKMKSDGLKIPKPDNQQFETLWYKDWLDKITSSESHTSFIEIFLKETGENADGDYIQFNADRDEEQLELTGSEAQFQTHRDLEAEKTLDIFSSDDNQELYFLAGLGVITMINLGGMYIIVNGLDSAVVKGIKEGFKTTQAGVAAGQDATSIIPIIGFVACQQVQSMIQHVKNIFARGDK